ncbi:MAG: protein kinase domain-containing protein, partial [Isosphaeraceae bacterium]
EAQIGGQLQHPGIVPIYELGAFADRRPYFAMKLVKGRTLATLLGERGRVSAPSARRGTPGADATGLAEDSRAGERGRVSAPSSPRGTPGADGTGLASDLPRFLAIFEQVAQTVAYAHARGVIHRDLKPSNIMVGSFGEVQVMDWGLAKVLPQGGAADDASAGKTREHGTVIATARSGGDSDSDLSRAGSVMGTPSYMAPEQARGEVDRLDERCDVFALGSVLCEILTGEPAFVGRSSGEIQRKASRGELSDALERLEASGSDVELIALTRDCLAPELEDRPRHAGLVAARINGYQASVQDRLRLAEIARAEEQARSEEATRRIRVERDRLRLTVALAASLVGLIVLGAGGFSYLGRLRAARRAETERIVTEAMDQVNLFRGEAKAAAIGDLSKWAEALAAAKNLHTLLVTGEPNTILAGRVNQLLADLKREQADAQHRSDEADRDRKFIERLQRIRLDRFEKSDWIPQDTDIAYSAAFREFEIDVDILDPAKAGRRLREHSNPMELAFFLDEWAQIRYTALINPQSRKPENDSWRRLIAISCAVDPDPWRTSLRGLVGGNDLKALERLAGDQKALAGQPARSLLLLAQLLEAQNDNSLAARVMKRAWNLRPDDFWTCFKLARSSDDHGVGVDSPGKERVRFASSAVSLRPGNPWAHVELAAALLASTDPKPLQFASGSFGMVTNEDRAEIDAIFEKASSHEQFSRGLGRVWFFLYPGNCRVLSTTPYFLTVTDEVITALRNAGRLNPDDPSIHRRLAEVLVHSESKLDEAIVEYRQACRLRPQDWGLRQEFAGHLFQIGRLGDAASELREALRIEPKNGLIKVFLGWVLQTQGDRRAAFAEFRQAYLMTDSINTIDPTVVAGFLDATGQAEELIAVYRDRIKSRPDDLFVIAHLGEIFRSQGKLEEERAVYLNVIGLKPDFPKVHGLYANVLRQHGKPDQAKIESDKEISFHGEAIRRNPNDAQSHQDYAEALLDRGRWDDAVKEMREAIRIAPSSDPFGSIGWGLYREGKLYEAIGLYREAVRFKPTDASAHCTLGASLAEIGDLDSALHEVREALRALPKDASFVDALGQVHLVRGELRAALAVFREALPLQAELDSYADRHLRYAERLAALEGRLDAIVRGQDVPASAEGRLDVAELCRVTKRFAAASRFYRDGFHAKPALADDLVAQHRLHAALAAARAGTNSQVAKDDIRLDDAERARWRAQSLEWLRAEKNACAGIIAPTTPAAAGPIPIPAVTGDPPKRAIARKTLEIMTHHRDLACVRDDKELAKLPEPERKAWQAFWREVGSLLKKADQD